MRKKSPKEAHMCEWGWFSLLYSRYWHSRMKQLYSSFLLFFKEKARIQWKLENCVYGEERVVHIYKPMMCNISAAHLKLWHCLHHLYVLYVCIKSYWACMYYLALILPKSWFEFFPEMFKFEFIVSS